MTLKSQHGSGVMGSMLGTGTSPRAGLNASVTFPQMLPVVVPLKIHYCLKAEAIEAILITREKDALVWLEGLGRLSEDLCVHSR